MSEADILARLAAICAGDDSAAAVDAIAHKLVAGLLAKVVTMPGSPVEGRDPAELAALVTGDDDLERHLDVMVRLGPWGDGFGADPDGITLQKLKDHPEGIDCGPMEPRLAEVVVHPDGRVRLCPPEFAAQVPELAADLDREWPEFVLIGRRALRSNNSWMHNLPDLVGGSNRCTLQVSVADAERLGVAAGDEVLVRSAVGEVTVAVEPIPGIRDGVVSLPHGWGHDDAAISLGVARTEPGVNANSLTDHRVIDVLSGNAVFNGVPVSIVAT